LKINLVLTGMMGVGKSTVGKVLSKSLSMGFLDIDKIIEKELKMPIREIFESKGEAFFRKFEEKITLQQIKKKNSVISLGGGAFMNSNIRKNILLNNKSFWLDLNLILLEKRLLNSKNRPLLSDKNFKETLKKIYNKRKDTYATANYKINCNNLSSKLIVDEIIKLYANH